MKTTLTTIFLLVSVLSSGQYSYKLFGASTNLVSPSSRGAHVDSDGNTLMVFYDRHLSPGDFDICATKVDPSGNILWAKKYRLPSVDEDVCPLVIENSTSYVLLGVTGWGTPNPDGLILRINKSTGNCDLAKVFGGSSFDYFTFGVGISEQSFLVCGYTGNPSFSASSSNRGDGFLVELNFNLDTLRTRRIGANNLFDKFDRVVRGVDGHIILAGTRKPFSATPVGTPADYDDLSLVKVSYASFNPIWLRLYNHSGNLIEQPSALMQLSNGNIYVATQLPMLGSSSVLRLGSSGNVLQKTKLEELTVLGMSQHLGVSVLGYKGTTATISRLDPNGLTVGFSNSYSFGSTGQGFSWSLKTTPSGMVTFGGSHGNTRLFQLNADAFGQLGCNETTTVVGNTALLLDTARIFNPTLGRYPYKGSAISVQSVSISHSEDGCQGFVLPLDDIVIGVEQSNQDVIVKWNTAPEDSQTEAFEVEKSFDGYLFEKIGTVDRSSYVTDYSFRDRVSRSSLVYYRVKVLDSSGTSRYTPVVYLDVRLHGSVYPNPNSGTFLVSDDFVPYIIHNNLGEVLFRGESTFVNVPGLAPGVYTIRSIQSGEARSFVVK
ncbi:MAG: hypothetical protein QG580_274 [Patescibacteria group bacterium]|jgi:hypothetical protein|nr:hypothetical protein [Patescibacteria group bacterium]